MRISDWSSDVCSSDLRQSSIAVVQARPFFPSMFIEQEPQMPSRQDLRKVTVLSTSFLILISASSTIGPHSSRSTRSEEHTSELQPLMRISYAVFCLKKKNKLKTTHKIAKT